MYRYIISLMVVTVGLLANVDQDRSDIDTKVVQKVEEPLKSIDTALDIAKRDDKIIMIKAISKDCHYCTKMQRDALSDSDVVKIINRDFVAVTVDIDSRELPYGLECNMTPTFFFMDNKKNLFKTIPGAWNRDDFIEILKEVKESYEKRKVQR